MRALPILLAAGLATSLLTAPSLTLGQSPDAHRVGTLPLARQPHGTLPLEGTPWRLVAYRWQGVEREPGPKVAASMRLVGGAIDASGGCRRIIGDYETVGAAIGFDLRRLKEADCGEQATLVQQAMVDGLRRAMSWEVVPGDTPMGDTLVLRNAGGTAVLRFELDERDQLERADWLLTAYARDGAEVAASDEQVALLSFVPEEEAPARRRSSGRLTGSSGCNGIVAEYSRQADVLSFSELQRTDAPCTPELAAQEAAMAAVLDASALTVELGHDQLQLTSADTGARLTLVSTRPLEGSTWLLQPGAWMARPDGSVTMRLEDGLASGEGPCGSYSATYRSDGVFISFDDVRGANTGDCDRQRAENALVAGLRRAVLSERDGPTLTFLDAAGEATLVFAAATGP